MDRDFEGGRWGEAIRDLGLKIAGTPLEVLIQRVQGELTRAGLTRIRPRFYLSTEWGVSTGTVAVAIPFYLASPALTEVHARRAGWVEGIDEQDILRYLRHELGHAVNYAYRLYEREDWIRAFGPITRPYLEEYRPVPFSSRFVRHLPGWYAQKHPDEDFAETFAVWLDPQSNWREVYADWGCLRKLMYLDELAHRIGPQAPPVTADNYDTQEEYLGSTIAEHYHRSRLPHVEIPQLFDAALRDIFQPTPADGGSGKTAAEFLRKHRRTIVRTVFYWTGLNFDVVRGLVIHLEDRCAAMGLQLGPDRAAKLTEVV